MARPTIVDLFCGAGGFSLGAHRAGFDTALAVDVDPLLASPIGRNLQVRFRELDLGEVRGSELAELVGGRPDGVIGGPPCQGFSEIGRSDQSDVRNRLVEHFYRHVAALEPRFFIMENVRGITFEYGRGVLAAAMKHVENKYDIVGPVLIDASKHGAPTKRPRVVVIGTHKSENVRLGHADFCGNADPVKVKDAIGDLAECVEAGEDDDGFGLWSYGNATQSAYALAARTHNGVLLDHFSGHGKTVHTDVVAARFAAVPQGVTDAVGRHQRLSWEGFSPTLRAGTGSDKGSYQSVRPLHPSQPRVITVREAARLQSFPDWYRFHPTIWHSFRMIGNSVPPAVSESLLRTVWGALTGAKTAYVTPKRELVGQC